MLNKQFFYPCSTGGLTYRSDICSELNIELYDLRRDGTIGFSYPQGTHDDVFWSIALAVYETTEMAPEPFVAVIPEAKNQVANVMYRTKVLSKMRLRRLRLIIQGVKR
jgi:hypothetical protein